MPNGLTPSLAGVETTAFWADIRRFHWRRSLSGDFPWKWEKSAPNEAKSKAGMKGGVQISSAGFC
jgi:hypothetical protein